LGGVAESTEPTRVAESKARARRTTSKAPVAAPVAAEILDESPVADPATSSVIEAKTKAPLARVTKSKRAVKGAAAQEAAAIEDVDAAGALGGVAESTEPTRVAESKARARRTTSKAPVAAPVAAEILDESPRKDEPIAVTQQTSPIGAH